MAQNSDQPTRPAETEDLFELTVPTKDRHERDVEHAAGGQLDSPNSGKDLSSANIQMDRGDAPPGPFDQEDPEATDFDTSSQDQGAERNLDEAAAPATADGPSEATITPAPDDGVDETEDGQARAIVDESGSDDPASLAPAAEEIGSAERAPAPARSTSESRGSESAAPPSESSLTVSGESLNTAPIVQPISDIGGSVGGPGTGFALSFNEHGRTGDVATIRGIGDFPTDAITVSLTFSSTDYPSAAETNGTSLFSYAVGGSNNEFLLFAQSNGQLGVYINGRARSLNADMRSLFDGDYHHLAVSWDSADGSLELYIDGSPAVSATHQAGRPIAAGGTLTLGQEQDRVGGGFDARQEFSGRIADVQVFDGVRSAADIAQDAQTGEVAAGDPTLVLGYDFANGAMVDAGAAHTLSLSANTSMVGNGGLVVEENGGPLTGQLNATDADGDALSYSLLTGPALGTLVLSPDGSFTFSPGADFEALAAGETQSVEFTFQVSDGHGGTAQETVTIDVSGTNDAPIAAADAISTGENTAVTIDALSNDSDPDTSDTLTITGAAVTGGHGSVSIVGGQLSYDPGGAYDSLAVGETANVLINYTIADGNGGVDTATVSVTVTGTNDGPIAQADTATTLESRAVTIDVLSNDSDPDTSDGLTILNASITSGSGTVAIVGNQLQYDPGNAYDGLIGGQTALVEIEYTIADGNGGTSTSSATVSVDGVGVHVTGPGFHVGTAGADHVTGTNNAESAGGEEIVVGYAGNDVLRGHGNEDRLIGGDGDDQLDGGSGNDILAGGRGDDTAVGGANNDVYVFRAGDGNDHFSGGTGTDGILLAAANGGSPAPADWTLNLTSGNATWHGDHVDLSPGATGTITFTDGSTLTFDTVERIDWSGHYGVDGNRSVAHIADAGGDRLTTGATEDTIFGGSGHDRLTGGANEDLLLGGDGNDTLRGGTENDFLSGDAGNDLLLGDSGDDVLVGGAGADALRGGRGTDTLFGGDGNDRLRGDSGNDALHGGEGDDTFEVYGGGHGTDQFNGGAGTDTITGGRGNDTIRVTDNLGNLDSIEAIDGGSGGFDTVLGTGGDDRIDLSTLTVRNIDRIDGGRGDDTITGTAGNDRIYGNVGNDTLRGGDGDDTFEVYGGGHGTDQFRGGAGTDTITGGRGNDTIRVTDNLGNLDSIEAIDGGSGGFDTVLGTGGDDTIDLSTLTVRNIDRIDGGRGDDTITGTAGNDRIYGNVGNDTLRGGDGDDTFEVYGGGHGTDQFNGGAGTDTITGGRGNDTIRVTDNLGNLDSIEAIDGGSGGFDTVLGTSGDDTIDLSTLTVRNIDRIDGGAGDDTITGTAANDRIYGNRGNDTLRGGDGDDTFEVYGGGHGTDQFHGGAGTDTITGGRGNDTIRVTDNLGNLDSIEAIDGGSGGFDTVRGTGGDDRIDLSTLTVRNIDRIDGGRGDDTITGTAGNDRIYGNVGNDTLRGGDGDDTFEVYGGGHGTDQFHGGAGTDTITGGRGNDTIRVTDNLGNLDSIEAIDGGSGGFDTVLGTGGDDTIDLSTLTVRNIDRIDGGRGDDIITGTAGNDRIYGNVGNDTLHGGDGDDTFEVYGGGHGTDQFHGGAGTDTITGGRGNDTIRVTDNLGNLDSIEAIDGGSGGFDTVLGTGGDDNLDLSGLTLRNIDRIDGGAGDDIITGTAGSESLRGNRGDDTLRGGDGNDQFLGDAGNDLFVFDDVSAGGDTVSGGRDTDTIDLTAVSQGWTVALDNGDAFRSTDPHDPSLMTDDAGIVMLDDGSTITFSGVENLLW